MSIHWVIRWVMHRPLGDPLSVGRCIGWSIRRSTRRAYSLPFQFTGFVDAGAASSPSSIPLPPPPPTRSFTNRSIRFKPFPNRPGGNGKSFPGWNQSSIITWLRHRLSTSPRCPGTLWGFFCNRLRCFIPFSIKISSISLFPPSSRLS